MIIPFLKRCLTWLLEFIGIDVGAVNKIITVISVVIGVVIMLVVVLLVISIYKKLRGEK